MDEKNTAPTRRPRARSRSDPLPLEYWVDHLPIELLGYRTTLMDRMKNAVAKGITRSAPSTPVASPKVGTPPSTEVPFSVLGQRKNNRQALKIIQQCILTQDFNPLFRHADLRAEFYAFCCQIGYEGSFNYAASMSDWDELPKRDRNSRMFATYFTPEIPPELRIADSFLENTEVCARTVSTKVRNNFLEIVNDEIIRILYGKLTHFRMQIVLYFGAPPLGGSINFILRSRGKIKKFRERGKYASSA